MRFEFATATRIVFGSGRIEEAVSAAASFGRRGVIVTGSTPSRAHSLSRKLQDIGVECSLFSISGEPTIQAVLDGASSAKSTGCEFVIGYGGGSALDTAKAVSALLTNPGDPLDYLEVVGKGLPLSRPCAPCICIPTTAGTGSEVTRNSVLSSPEHGVKVSLRSPRLFPLLAVIDPDLTHSLPPSITASTGMDALTQVIEPFISGVSNPATDALCREGIRRAVSWLPAAYRDGSNPEARENMAIASLFGGIALTNAGLGAVHGIAAPLGGVSHIPHGIVCARLLAIVMEANLKALRSRIPDSPALARYGELAALLTGRAAAQPEEGIEVILELCSGLSIPALSALGLSGASLHGIAEKAQKASSMKGNPIQLTIQELMGILEKAL